MTRARAAVATMLVLAALLPGSGAADRGDLAVTGLDLRDRTAKQMEGAALASPPEELRSFSSRLQTWVIVADSRAEWDRSVAPAIAEALGSGGGPDVLRERMDRLGGSLEVSGPDLDGGLVRLDLPADRGRAYVAFHFPKLLKRGRDPGAILNSKRPNVGLFVAGADVRREDKDARGDRLLGLYLPSRPKPLTRGAPPSVEVRALPKEGRGALGVFGGRGEVGEEADLVLRDLKRFVGRDSLDAEMMRSVPHKGDLFGSLRTIRVRTDALVRDDDWYRALSADPTTWDFEPDKLRHPARYLATSAPVVTVLDVDGRQVRREVVVGIVVLYAPLLLTPEEAPLYCGTSPRSFYEAVQRGEVPFLRIEKKMLFYRPWLDRWRTGDGLDGGRSLVYKDARQQAFAWADRIRSRALDKAARGPFPFRLEPIPRDELDEMVDRSRRYRGRVMKDDLSEWLGHFDPELRAGDLEPRWTLAERSEMARHRTAWAMSDTGVAVAAADRREPSTEAPPRGPNPQARAPEFKESGSGSSSGSVSADLDDLGLGGDRGWESGDEDDGVVSYEEDADLDTLGGEPEVVPIGSGGDWEGYGGGGGPARLTRLDVLDMYAGACRPGEPLDAVVEFVLEGPAEGELADLRVEWDLELDGRNLRRDAFDLARESGPQEVELDIQCPDAAGSAELHVLLAWPDKQLETAAYTEAAIRGASQRSWAKLVMPREKRCLDADLGGGGDDEDFGIQVAQGLDAGQISAAVRGFQEQTLRCQPDGGVTGTVSLEISVGCSGRVREVEVVADETGDYEFSQCVAETMKYCPFPAHARDEAIFEMPLRYE